MNRLFYFFSSILFLTSLNATAKETCSSKDLLDRSCEFYYKNSDKEFLITSNGRKYRNPLYVPSQQTINSAKDRAVESIQNGNTITAMYPAIDEEKMAAQMDSILELGINTENILASTEAKKWPIKSFRSISNPSVIFKILESAFPEEKAFEAIQTFKTYIPKPITDPKGKMAELNATDIEDLKKTLGAENLKKLKAIYLEQSKNVTYNPYPVEIVPPKTATPLLSDEKFNEGNKRIEKLHRYAQEKIINLIKNGRSDSQLTAEQKSLIKKVETVQYMSPRDSRAQALGECASGGAAYYYGGTHSLTVCEVLYELPDSQVILALSHEIGHSIDPCMSQNVLHEINSEKLDQMLHQHQSPQESASYQDQAMNNVVKTLSQLSPNYINAFDDETLDTSVEKSLAENGIMRRATNGVSEKNYPFNTIRSCLISEENIDDISDSDIEAEINYLKSYRKRTGTPLTQKEEQDIRLQKNKMKTCAGSSLKKSEVNEAMCDFFGSFTQAQYLNDNPPKNEIDAFASMSLFTADSCGDNPKLKNAQRDQMASLKENHPHSFRRLHSIFFKMPGVSNYFGCELKPKSKCFTNYENLLNRKSNSSSSKEATQK